eukprot:s2535_g7.t1
MRSCFCCSRRCSNYFVKGRSSSGGAKYQTTVIFRSFRIEFVFFFFAWNLGSETF